MAENRFLQPFVTHEHNGIGNQIDLPIAKSSESVSDKQLRTDNNRRHKEDNIESGKFEPKETETDSVDSAQNSSSKALLTLPNGVQVTFGQMLALAGDYYGIPGKPIVNPNLKEGRDEVDSGRHDRFNDAYKTLAEAPYDEVSKRIEKLVKMCEEDSKQEETTTNGHRKSGKCYHSDKEWDEATGGIWIGPIPIIPGRMLKLAENNYDHFLPQAKDAYIAGHEMAIEKAREAASKDDAMERNKILLQAYSMDAFACHFLTDSFSSGHIRTPRVELGKSTTPAQVGHLLSKYMHDEDNKFGLRVTNFRGDKWIAYGDGMLLEECSEDNLRLVVEATQKSVYQVYEAFQKPEAKLRSSLVTDLIPFVDSTAKNNSPLFQMKDGELHRRSDVHNLQDTSTTSNWWGITTASKLQSSDKRNSAIKTVE